MPGAPEPLELQVVETLKTNYYALKNVCNALFPLLRPHARVVTLSSSAGHLKRMVPGEELRKKIADPDLTEEKLDQLMQDFVRDVKDGSYKEKGWPTVPYTAYAVSKVAASALTRIQHQRFLKDPREDIVINHVHPGYVDTDLVGHQGPLTTDQGAVAPVYAALLPANCKSPRGDFIWHTKEIVDWVNGPCPSAW
uniref:Carbonyl reductase [NADPH] 1 n=1 Tax=Lygus hesperus TaxID=30085 RepID=A0A0A9WJE2_LYGHE